MTLHSIGQVARQSGVGVETVRFYEREGLIPQPSRPEEETLRTAGVGTPIP